MNILVLDSWLREYLETTASAQEIAKYLSLCGQSVEKTIKKENDWIYDIEITTNRPDCLSVYGIARELSAILPQNGITAKLKSLSSNFECPNDGLKLEVKIEQSSLCPRFTALVFDNIKIKPSPKIVQNRLESCGIRALNNVVDISNYLMLELGQPMHTFDYDKILGQRMILRESRENEEIVTLDGQKRKLSTGTIIIEDGERRIIDLCGIMGGENSAVDENTKRVLLFVQTYDPAKIRLSCQRLSFRTEAASRFEKGVDAEGVVVAMAKATQMFRDNCGVKIAGPLIDIYPNPQKEKDIKFNPNLITKIMGIDVSEKQSIKILESLGFEIETNFTEWLVKIPYWRVQDTSIPEDLVEEIARVYGYHNLPSNLPEGKLPVPEKSELLSWEKKIKEILRTLGLTEIYNYSLISEKMLLDFDRKKGGHLKIANPLTDEWVYLRKSLFEGLLQVISKNQARYPKIKIFEIANIYKSRGNNELPEERLKLAAMFKGVNFYEARGIIETLFDEIGLSDYRFDVNGAANIKICFGEEQIGLMGVLPLEISVRFDVSGEVILFETDIGLLIKYVNWARKYQPTSIFPAILEDLTFVFNTEEKLGEIIRTIKNVDEKKWMSDVSWKGDYQNEAEIARTFAIVYQAFDRALTVNDIAPVRKLIVEAVEKEFGAKLKGKLS